MTRIFLMAVAGLAMTGAAAAHSGGAAGFVHPFTGWDHLITMVAIGVLAARLGGRAVYLLPLSFLGLMVVGGGLGVAGAALPFVESMIVASVIIISAAALLPVRMPLVLAAGLAGIFAVFHGFAHGAEMPAGGSAVTYALGFLAATALLHGVGLALGAARRRLVAA